MDRETTIHPIGTLGISRPQQEWGWIIAVDLYLAGMGAGSYIIGTFIDLFGYPLPLTQDAALLGIPLNLSKAVFLWGPILVSIGAPLLVFDLGRKERFLYACLKPGTSWIADGFIIISIFIIVGLATITLYVWPFRWLEGAPSLRVVMQLVGLLFAFGTAFYTGMLLKSVESVTLWNTSLLPLLFVISSLSTGSMGIILSTLAFSPWVAKGESFNHLLKILITVQQIFVLVEGTVLTFYLFLRFRAKNQGESSVRMLISGDLKLVFWGGIVLLGFVFPIVLEYLYAHFPDYPILLFAAGFFLLAGRLFLRFSILTAGIKDQPPLQKLIKIESIQESSMTSSAGVP